MDKIIFKNRVLKNPRKRKIKNLSTQEIIDIELQDDPTNIQTDSDTPINAETLNQLQYNIENELNNSTSVSMDIEEEYENNKYGKLKVTGKTVFNRSYYPVGRIISTTSNEDPNTIYPGQIWKKIRTYHGGELLAYGQINTKAPGVEIPANSNVAFGSNHTGTAREFKTYNLYDEPILEEISNSTFKVNTRGIVGMIEADMYISGLGMQQIAGLWFGGNGDVTPPGIELLDTSINCLLTGPVGNSYGGCSNKFIYSVNTGENKTVTINPTYKPYNGNFKPSMGGTRCHLIVKVYAKNEIQYIWKRTS